MTATIIITQPPEHRILRFRRTLASLYTMTSKPHEQAFSPDAVALEYQRLRSLVDETVDQITVDFLRSLGDDTGPLSAAVRDATQGGKRFRALCAQIGAAIAADLDEENRGLSSVELLQRGAALPGVMELCAALEQYQAAALVHDDVIDKSDVRRGRPSTHMQIRHSHEDRNLMGNQNIYGQDGAILAGDLLLAAAENSLARSLAGADSETSVSVLRHYAFMTGQVALGQFRDMTGSYIDPAEQHQETNPQSALESALSVLRVKAALYSVVHPAVLGALRAGADDQVVQTLMSILEPAGIAFQLRDDELGAFGDATVTGKPVGIDISEGKRTVLLALAWKNSDEAERALLANAYRSPSPTAEQVEEAVAVLAKNGRQEHEEMIAELSQRALTNLEESNLSEGAEGLLRFLVSILTERDS